MRSKAVGEERKSAARNCPGRTANKAYRTRVDAKNSQLGPNPCSSIVYLTTI